jgi:hypothetical protein
MKKFTIILAVFSAIVGFGQNQSSLAVASSITSPATVPPLTGEVFRFSPGLVTQFDSGTGFDFTSSWFSLGKLNTGSQTVYGLRFQLPNKALTLGYRNLADVNPRLEWVGSGAGLGNLEFRAANSFTSTISNLVATMTNDGNTYFGDALFTNTKVGIDYKTTTGLSVRTTLGSSSYVTGIKLLNNTSTYVKEAINIEYLGSSYANSGLVMNLSGAVTSSGVSTTVAASSTTTGINSTAKDGASSNVAVRGTISNAGGFGAAIYGISPTTNTNWHAGYFDGKVVVNGVFSNPSDKKLKTDINDEKQMLDKLMQLNPVNYNFLPNDKINLPDGLQHGFLAQNIEQVFPELIIPVKKPIYGKEGEVVEYYDYKTVNYIGIISLLTSGIKELNEKVKSLEEALGERNNSKPTEKLNNSQNNLEDSEFSMEQNVPNPFDNQTTINYTLPKNTKASLTVFDMTGKLIKDFILLSQKGQVLIQASDIGKGMFLYSLVSNNREVITKKMIIK